MTQRSTPITQQKTKSLTSAPQPAGRCGRLSVDERRRTAGEAAGIGWPGLLPVHSGGGSLSLPPVTYRECSRRRRRNGDRSARAVAEPRTGSGRRRAGKCIHSRCKGLVSLATVPLVNEHRRNEERRKYSAATDQNQSGSQ